mgnify:FL=1
MSDNINVTPGAGDTVAADDVGGVKHQRVKITLGGDGVSDGDVASGNPMPVTAPDLASALEAALLMLAAILESMPRTDANARAIVNTSDQGNVTVAIAATQTLATVTTVGTVSNQTNIGGRDASNTAYAMANMGTAHIYNNIIVS